MTLLKKSLAAAAVLALAGGGVAQAAPASSASKLSVAANARVGAPVKATSKSRIAGVSTGLLVAIGAAVVAGTIAIASSGGSNSP